MNEEIRFWKDCEYVSGASKQVDEQTCKEVDEQTWEEVGEQKARYL